MRAQMTIVFQEPYQSLNPRQRIGTTIAEPLVIHERRLSAAERRARVVDALSHVALNESFYDRYPHEISGGQQQRVGVARAIVTRPKFIVLDEPTSSLDLSVRAQILQLLADLQMELNLAYLFISHDIHTVRYISDRICVMYLGQIVETGPAEDVFRNPQHPYTQALLSSTLSADPRVKRDQVPARRRDPVRDEPAAGLLPPRALPECGPGVRRRPGAAPPLHDRPQGRLHQGAVLTMRAAVAIPGKATVPRSASKPSRSMAPAAACSCSSLSVRCSFRSRCSRS